METSNHTTTFWHFLENYSIEIPIIQRDYAQGRIGKENLRKSFLNDLKEALDKLQNKMKLDFVYGSTENGKLYPLDGQQRLTTLWLLHWYIALKAGKLDKASSHLKKFSYETRISSRNFCEEMCKPENFENYNCGYDVVEYITNQTWFYSAWKQDPTIQSVLRMLGGSKDKIDFEDGIERVFGCRNCISNKGVKFNYYYNLLTGECCPIVFYFLPKDFGNSDDLYIKMNARGEQLTSFENYKADLIGYITKQSEDNTLEKNIQKEWKKLLDPKDGIPIKIDTDWTDIFWKNKSKGLTDNESKTRKSNQIDEIYFAFLNRFFWNELFIAKNSDNNYILDIGKGDESSTQENNNPSYKYLNNSEHNNDATIAYEGLDVYRYDNATIPLLFFQKIKRVLDNYFAYSKNNNSLPECPWETSFRFIPIYEVKNDNNIEITNNTNDKILSVSTLNQVQRIVFFAVCKYFDHDVEVSDSETSLNRWMRVVWNLVSGEDQNGRPEIRSTSALRAAIKFIDSLESHTVYESLCNYDVNKLGDSSFDERCKEEIVKAMQILNKDCESCKKIGKNGNQTWEDVIIKAESYAFFKGAIRFLFTDGEGNINWCDFDKKWGNLKKYFDKNGKIVEEYKTNAILLRALLSRINIGENWFGYYKEFWYKSFLNKDYQSAIHYLLTTHQLEIDKTCSQDWITHDSLLQNLLCCYNSWHILTNWNNYDVLTRYSQRRSDATSHKEIVVLNYLRNRLLHNDKIEIWPETKVNQTSYLYGWDIQFTYQSKFFQWHREGYVRLIQDRDKCEPLLRDKERESTLVNWYWFKPTSEVGAFTKQLDCLIAQAFPEESDKACCNDCQNKICE